MNAQQANEIIEQLKGCQELLWLIMIAVWTLVGIALARQITE
jgi:hypothetical protein